ncbi:hypothetical protein D3C71_1933840 [compost metagenome]
MGAIVRRQIDSRQHIHETACAMHAHGLSALQTAQTDGCSMLVACTGKNGHFDTQQLVLGDAKIVGVLPEPGQ